MCVNSSILSVSSLILPMKLLRLTDGAVLTLVEAVKRSSLFNVSKSFSVLSEIDAKGNILEMQGEQHQCELEGKLCTFVLLHLT